MKTKLTVIFNVVSVADAMDLQVALMAFAKRAVLHKFAADNGQDAAVTAALVEAIGKAQAVITATETKLA